MADKAWKRAERRVARLLGTKRTGPTGKAGYDACADPIGTEIKYCVSRPVWLNQLLDQMENHRKEQPDLVPVGIVLQHGEKTTDGVAILRLSDLAELIELIPSVKDP